MFERIKKGVGLFKMAFEKESLDSKRIIFEINKFKTSDKFQWMQTGMRYYDVDHDILSQPEDMRSRANRRLAHATYKNIVDEKVAYAFSKTPTLRPILSSAEKNSAKDDAFLQKIKDSLGKYWEYEIESLAYEASNKGIGWLHPYIDERGRFKMFVPPSEQIIPIWQDSSHFRLDAVIRIYESFVWVFGREEKAEFVELWTKDSFKKYRKTYDTLVEVETGLLGGHFLVDGAPQSWDKVPFIPFKNNRRELGDIKFVKSLVDNYDLSRSEVANYIAEVTNYVMVVSGYDVYESNKLRTEILENRLVVLDEDGTITALTPEVNIGAAKEHYERIFKDIKDSGQAVDKSLDHFGSAPSGIALQFLYSGLDLKCSAIESEFRRGFDGLMYFVHTFLSLSSDENLMTEHEIEIVFNRNITIDEETKIKSAVESKGVISDVTILAHHPWVNDTQEEIRRLDEQQKKEEASFNFANLPKEE